MRKRFKDQQFYDNYVKLMKNIIEKGYAKKVALSRLKTEESKVWYLPQHGIYHPKKQDKIRVVFDCSCQYKGRSLNKELLQGPDMTNSLVGVLSRFQQEPIAFMADIEAMCYQVPEEQQSYLRFLWWPDGNIYQELEEYEMCVHLFGAIKLSVMYQYGFKETADDSQDSFGKEAVAIVKRDFYVDDLLKSQKTEESAFDLVKNVREMCASGSFKLTKFISNNRRVLETIPVEDHAKGLKDLDLKFDSLPIERALGMLWNVENDTLEFKITLVDKLLTHRGILATVSSTYDPLGLVGPLLLPGRRILQQICCERKDWDEPVSDEIRCAWEKWRQDLQAVDKIKLDHCYKPADFGDLSSAQLHLFSDASTVEYDQASYLCMENTEGSVHCSLVLGKSRVAPAKLFTVPRLELTAASLSVKVGYMLQSELSFEELSEVYWTDSQVVLGYINNHTKRFHVFVANRVQLINDHTDKEQRTFMDSKNNPADHGSRGLSGKKFLQAKSWFHGPEFLWKSVEHWPKQELAYHLSENDPEVRTKRVDVNVVKIRGVNEVLENLEKRISEWQRLKKILATVLKVLQQKSFKKVEVNVVDLQLAESLLIRYTQQREFQEERSSLKTSKPYQEFADNAGKAVQGKRSKRKLGRLFRLEPFLDEHGIL